MTTHTRRILMALLGTAIRAVASPSAVKLLHLSVLAVLLGACTSHMGTGLPVTPQPSILLTLSGSGAASSAAFEASGLSIDFAYTYVCGSSSTGHFAI